MFTQDFREDGKRLVEMFYADTPFALARFGDGEAAIMFGGEHRAKSDGWHWDKQKTELPRLLRESLAFDRDGYYVGLANGADQPIDFVRLSKLVSVPIERRTFCEILMFANYRRYATQLDISDSLVIGRCCEVETPHEPYAPEWENWRSILDVMLETDKRAIVLCAGPWSCVLAHQYWLATEGQPNRKICVDLGSAISVRFRRRSIRRYHHRDSVVSRDNLGFWPS